MEQKTLLIDDREYDLLSRDVYTDYFDEVSRDKRYGIFYRLKSSNKKKRGKKKSHRTK